MESHDDDQTAPRGLKRDDAGISTELPAVVFGDDETLISSELPRVRVLPGRLHEAWILYPIYALVLGAGVIAVEFALRTHEWSAIVVGLAWFLLYVWNWFYGIAYRYRRRVLKYTSVIVILGLTAALAYFSIERGQPQLAMTDLSELRDRPEAASLYGAAVAAVVAAGLLITHLLFLGRGYRQKKS